MWEISYFKTEDDTDVNYARSFCLVDKVSDSVRYGTRDCSEDSTPFRRDYEPDGYDLFLILKVKRRF